ncbi:MAG TPA: TetR family transcriptional regulator [Amycolatopsis sp.]|jgi:AcrR family transcriptional regulator
MIARTVDWTPPHQAGEDSAKPEGLRERKKRRMRQQLTDTATEMFLERGFDAVRVAEIADACGVSEKTVFNYFPTKEALIVDHPGAAMDALRSALADPGLAPVDAVLRILAGELDAMTSWLGAQPDLAGSSAKLRRFGALIAGTPSLRAYQRDMMDRLAAVATEALAERAGLGPDDPEPRIAATALLGLWPIQFSGWARYADGVRTPAQIRDAVTADVRKAARLLDGGLSLLTAQR